MPCTGTTLLSLVLSLGFMSLFCSHSYFVLPFVFVSLVLTSFRSTSLSSISCAFIFLFNLTLSAYFLPLFFLASFLVICSFVFMSCTFPSVSGHSPLMQHCELTLPSHWYAFYDLASIHVWGLWYSPNVVKIAAGSIRIYILYEQNRGEEFLSVLNICSHVFDCGSAIYGTASSVNCHNKSLQTRMCATVVQVAVCESSKLRQRVSPRHSEGQSLIGSALLTLRLLMSYIYIYGASILDVSRSHTTTQHSR